MNRRNYQRELEALLWKENGEKSLFLHCCCAPCSSYVLEYLHPHFSITAFFYNPNITEWEEYKKRKEEWQRYLACVPFGKAVRCLDADHEPERFLQAARGYEREPERGGRCERCFRLRLQKTAELAAEYGADYFCTTLSISPHKDAALLMEIGEELAERYGVSYLPSDFKKRNGYKRSIELSRMFNLYRQDYCGCIFSKKQREKERENAAEKV